MEDRKNHLQLGLGAIIVSAFFLVVLIPNYVSSPTNVPRFILSPLMWPYTIAGATGLIGLAMFFNARRLPHTTTRHGADTDDPARAYGRLLLLGLIMIATIPLMPWLGLPLTSMGVFILLAALVRTNHPKTALICAICIPLFLYFFFAHVAGVSIPQGNFLRLP